MNGTTPSRAALLVQRRLLERDSRSLVVQRLSQPMLAQAFRWYRHPAGLGGGERLLARAPAVDTLLARTLSNSTELGNARGARAQGLCAFGAGLMVGVRLRDAIEANSPFDGEPDLEEALRRLEEWDGHGTVEPGWQVLDAREALAIAAGLVRREPSLDLLLHSAHRLACKCGEQELALEIFQVRVAARDRSIPREACPWSLASDAGASGRFLVVLGLVAAGFRPPAVPNGPTGGPRRAGPPEGSAPDRDLGEDSDDLRPLGTE